VLAQLIGAALILRGLKVVPVANPFTPFARDARPEQADERSNRRERERPRALAAGALLFVVGLALLVLAGVVRQQ